MTKFKTFSAHCVMDIDKKNKTVKISENNMQVGFGENELMSGGSQRSNVFRSIIHVDYDWETFENDIALLMLQTQIAYKSSVLPICLPQLGVTLEEIGTIVGFGGTKSDRGGSSGLRHAMIPIVSDEECSEADPDFFNELLNRGNFCAGKKGELKNVCSGDSGETIKSLKF